MPYIRIMAFALAGSSLVALPASARGLLGGRSNCLCNGAKGALSRGAAAAPIGRSGGLGIAGMGRHGSAAASVTSSVKATLGVTNARHGGRFNREVGLAGSVSSVTNATLGTRGLGKGIGLAGHSSTHVSVAKQVGIGLAGVNGNHRHGTGVLGVSALSRNGTKGRAPATVAIANRSAGLAGKVANVSALNRTGSTGQPLANVALLNGTGGTSGKVVNVSALNRTGSTGRSAVNVAALNGSGGMAGKVANVSILNRTGTTGKSAINVAVLNGHRHGRGNGGSPVLPNGIRLINGVPCLPDGTPLSASAAAAVMAAITTKGGSSHSGGSSNSGGQTGSDNGGSQGATESRNPARERDRADRKDLWWPPRPEQQSREGRLEDH